MTPGEEKAHERGRRSGLLTVLRKVLQDLGEEGSEHDWTLERAETITVLKELCENFGDLDWDQDLYIPDILRNHLREYLNADADEQDKEIARAAFVWVKALESRPADRDGDLGELFAALLRAVERADAEPRSWTTGIPEDGVYWWRSKALKAGGICHVATETVFMTTNTMPAEMPEDIEFQGPITAPQWEPNESRN